MRIQLNGESFETRDAATVGSLLGELGLDPERVAVEHNRRILKRGDFPEIPLAPDDVLEVVTFVGGG